MTLSQLRALLAVIDHGGFTAAADRLGMSQPAVSRAITAIEEELKVVLLTRSRDGALLTDAGRLAVLRARESLRQFDLLYSDVAAAAGQLTGTLRLASLPSATGTLIAPHVRTFTKQYPQVQIRLFEGTDQEVRDWIMQGAAELGVVTFPAGDLPNVALGSDEFVVLLPADHSLKNRVSIGFDALVGEDFVLPTGGCGPLITTAADNAGTHLQIAYEAREQTAILAMVAEGLGVSIMPTLGLPSHPEGVVIRPLEPRIKRRLAMAYLPGPSSIAQAFLHQIEMSRPRTQIFENV